MSRCSRSVGWPPASHQTLFFAGDERRDDAYVREMSVRFLPRAYRRPVTDEEIDSIVAVVKAAQTTGKLSFHDAMRVGLQRVLCAPGFLFLEEPAGEEGKLRPLNDYELASRLSYFLWSTMPDDELLSLAAAGKLHAPATVTEQVQRMIADPKSDQLVKNFAGQWLSVRDYGSIKPAAEYRDYDPPLEQASQQEPFAFFAEVLHKNLPIMCSLIVISWSSTSGWPGITASRKSRDRSSGGWLLALNIIVAACWAWPGC